MKIMIASDIHGSAAWCRQLTDRFRQEEAHRLILLGDLLYHGPRNPLPDEYSPPAVCEMLNPLASSILAVRGNCDSEVDQMVLHFPIMADYAIMPVGRRNMYITHGHLFGENNPPPLHPGDLLLCGHTHVPCCIQKEAGHVYLNPGSVSLPKENSHHGYLLLEGTIFRWMDLCGGEKNRWDAQEAVMA